ncbi:MAG: hypothetical protein NVSMB7_06150 [Chitinophagaceae bacterium]
MQCCNDASWEADIIILAVDKPMEIAPKIEEVATRKIVINIVSGAYLLEELQEFLPFSKVINRECTRHSATNENTNAFIDGYDDEARKMPWI